MYCNHCGQPVDENAAICVHCGYQIAQPKQKPEDKPSKAFAVLGFFLPFVGLILFLVYQNDKPKTAKLVGKSALAGFITGVAISIIFVILFSVIGVGLINHTVDNFDTYQDQVEQFYEEQSQMFTEEDVSQYVDIEFGEFVITENTYYIESTLNVIVTNNYEERCSYFITIEAVDENGNRLSTDTIFADRLNSGQSVELEAFSYISEEELEDYKNATFKVLDISRTIH